MTAFITGLITQLSLILAVGAQNAFILRQGLVRNHILLVCFVAALCDSILIFMGVLTFGAIGWMSPSLIIIITYSGAAFLVVYGVLRLRAAYRGSYLMELSEQSLGLRRTLIMLAGFTFLNPHVYLDTLGLIGAVSTQFADFWSKVSFAFGACVGSFVFFFSLGWGAQFLSPWMRSVRAWRILDILVGFTMFIIAALLISH